MGRHFRTAAQLAPADHEEFPRSLVLFRLEAQREARALVRLAARTECDLEELLGVPPRIREHVKAFCRAHPEEHRRFVLAFRYRALVLRYVRKLLKGEDNGGGEGQTVPEV
jgi:hypothetical protein